MASAVIGALRVNLSIDSAQFTNGLKGAQASLAKAGKSMQKLGTGLTTYVTAPLTAAGTAVSAALAGMANDVEQFRKSAQLSNTGFEDFQRLAFAAKSVGIEGEKLGDIFKDVNDKVGEFSATGGGELKDFFTNIAPQVGITADAFKNLSGPEALQLYYNSLKKAGLSQQQVTFYMEALADEATALQPLLENNGKGFQEIGKQAAVLSEQDGAGLQQYQNAIRGLGQALKSVLIAIVQSGVVETLTSVTNAFAGFVRTLSQISPGLVQFGAVVGAVLAVGGPVLVGLGLLVSALAALSTPTLVAIGAIASVATGITVLYQAIQAAMPYLQQLAGDIWARIKAAVETVSTAFDQLKQKVSQIAADIVNAFAALPAKMLEIGGQIVDGLVNGITTRWESAKGYVSDIFTSIPDRARSILGIKSPSRVMHQVGEFVAEGLANGITAGGAQVDAAASGLAQGVTSQISASGATGAIQEMESAGQSLASTLGNAFRGLIDGSKKLKDVLKDLAADLGSKLLDSGLNSIFGSLFSVGGGGFKATTTLGAILGAVPGFATGGSFQVGGAGGVDSQLVAFKASPNERVSITKPGQGRGGSFAPVYNIDARGSQMNEAQFRQIIKDENAKVMGQVRANVSGWVQDDSERIY